MEGDEAGHGDESGAGDAAAPARSPRPPDIGYEATEPHIPRSSPRLDVTLPPRAPAPLSPSQDLHATAPSIRPHLGQPSASASQLLAATALSSRPPASPSASAPPPSLDATALSSRPPAPPHHDPDATAISAIRARAQALRPRLDLSEASPHGATFNPLGGPPSGDQDETLGGGALSPAERRPAEYDPDQPKIGRYTVLRLLGQGGMGAVYSAYDEELDRRVAIKLVREHLAGDTLGHARMQREAQAMARLSHPNVVQVYDVGTHQGQVFIAMEFVRGTTLREWQEAQDPADPEGRRRLLDMYIQAGRGLAAAHHQGLVHRDFKPDNVLVGDDGRARVLDFGLATTGRGDEPGGAGAPARGADLLSSELTRTGSVMGTPAYMAPEQFLARPSDARTDQFSFCVALYGALYGELPFAGDTFAGREAAVCAGQVLPPPADTRVPPWLRAILLRGLKVRPEDRHPGMDALLAALGDDPEEARRRRLRALTRGLGLVAAALVLLYGATVAWRAWQHHRREATASERLALMEASVAELIGRGDDDDADRLFTAFVRHPEHRGTAALASAWLRRAARDAEATRLDQARDAYAAAYAVAATPEHKSAALIALVDFFHARSEWSQLGQAIATVERRAPEILDDPRLADARLTATLAGRDLDRASVLLSASEDPRKRRLRRVVDALTPATLTAIAPGGGSNGHQRRDPEFVLLRPGAGISRHAADLQLTQLSAHGTVYDHVVTVSRGDGTPPLYVAELARERELHLLQPDGERLVELHRWTDDRPMDSLVHDLDGDGTPEILIATGPYTRHVVELRRDPEGTWSTHPFAPSLDARASDVATLDAADVDGDGALEVIAALGAWRAYEIQALRLDAATRTLRTVARYKLGYPAAALLRRPAAPPTIAVWKSDSYINPKLFPAGSPRGAAAGLHYLRLVDGRLVPTGGYHLPSHATSNFTTPLVGDLDGDGLDELIIHRHDREREREREIHATLIFVGDGDGEPECIPLNDMAPVAVLDIDDDGDDELIGNLGDRSLWILGAGAAQIPAIAAGEAAPLAPPTASPDLVRVWEQAGDLADLGLDLQAAAALEGLADTAATADPPLAARALLRAAQLHAARHRDGLAAALYARAAADPDLVEEAGPAAILAYRRRGALDDARALADHLLARDDLQPAARRALADARAALGEPPPRHEVTFEAPLDPRWRLHQPLTLTRNIPASTLRIDAIGRGTIASLPVAWSGADLIVEVDIDLHRVEWGERLEIVLASPAHERPFGFDVEGHGGTGDQQVSVRCVLPGQSPFHNAPIDLAREEAGRHRIRAYLDPVKREATCTIIGPSGDERLYRRTQFVETVDFTSDLELRIAGQSANTAGWVAADLHRVTLIGAAPRDAADAPPLASTRHGIVEGLYGDTLRVLEEPGVLDGLDTQTRVRATFWRITALARLGRWTDAAELLRPLLTDPEAAASVAGPLTVLLRTAPETGAALLRSAGEPGLHRARIVDAWALALRMRPRDVLALEVLRRVLDDLDPAAPGDPADLALLFSLRADVRAELGMVERARADYAAAIDQLDRALATDPGEAAVRHRTRLSWTLEMASLDLRAGDPARARQRLIDHLADPDDEAYIHDVIDVRPEFAPILADLVVDRPAP